MWRNCTLRQCAIEAGFSSMAICPGSQMTHATGTPFMARNRGQDGFMGQVLPKRSCDVAFELRTHRRLAGVFFERRGGTRFGSSDAASRRDRSMDSLAKDQEHQPSPYTVRQRERRIAL